MVNRTHASTRSTWPRKLLYGLAICSVVAIVWGVSHPGVVATSRTPPAPLVSPHASATIVPSKPMVTSKANPSKPVHAVIAPCRQQAHRPFIPVSAELFGVGRFQAVAFDLVQDGQNVRLPVPPDDNPSIFAWVQSDRAANDTGMGRLTAHTWYDGRGLGNVLIDKATLGSVMILRGSQPSQVACYRIADRQQVTVVDGATAAQKARASRVLNRFNGINPADDLGIMVCAGKRISAGNYPDRLNLFAVRYGL